MTLEVRTAEFKCYVISMLMGTEINGYVILMHRASMLNGLTHLFQIESLSAKGLLSDFQAEA